MNERESRTPADLLLVNGRILTMDARETVAQAVAVHDGKIVTVGSNEEARSAATPGAEVVDLDGRTVLPGLTDCHVHLASDVTRSVGAVEARDLYVPAIQSLEDMFVRIREAVQSRPAGEWIPCLASPLQDTRLREGRYPTLAELDAVAPQHPLLIRFGPHVTVANSAALADRGVTRDTPDPQGGTVVKDPATGAPTGVMLERAQFLLRPKGIKMDPAALADGIQEELERCATRGVTGIHDVVIGREEIQAYQLLAREGRLPVRVQLMIRVIESEFDKQSLLDLGFVTGFGNSWLKIGGVKMSIDGGFTGKNAAFSDPIMVDGREERRGLVRINQDELDETIWQYHEMGMRCCVHAIGDIGMDMALEAYDKALTRLPRPDHRHRVEHLGNWMMSPERIERTRRLGLIPVPNPAFLFFFGDPVADMIGRRLTVGGFPFRSLVEAGIPITFGSDSPGYYPVDPLRDMGTAVAHQTTSRTRIAPDEALTLDQALRTQTVNAAHAGFMERRLGSLEPGKLADIAVLGQDPRDVAPEDYRDLPIDLTIAGGRITHAAAVTVPA